MKRRLPEFWSFNRSRDENLVKTDILHWLGPFSWNGFEQVNNLKSVPDIPGVYLFTVDYKDGYIIRSAGVTNAMKRRFSQHNREYKKGNYTVLDVSSARVGIRKEMWHGWDYAKKNRKEYFEHEAIILNLIREELRAYRIFVAKVDDKRKRERIEFAIIHGIYRSKDPWSNLVDGGMALRGRFNYEVPVQLENISPYKVYGLPEKLEI